MKILITGVGGPTPRSFALALKRYSDLREIELIGVDANPLSMGLYMPDLFCKSYVVPKASESEYWQVMETIIKENDIELAIILPEVEVLEWARRKVYTRLPCQTLIPDLGICELLFDKARMTEVLTPLNVVPKSIEFSFDAVDAERLGMMLGFPFWVRSSIGTSGLGSLKINDAGQLSHWININSKVEKFLASKYLPGRNIACKMLYFEGKLVRSACAERVQYIMAKVAPSGITGNTAFGKFINDPGIVEKVREIMEYLFEVTRSQKHGMFTVDLKENEFGTALITEINIRHVAFTSCFAAAGANFAADSVRLMIKDKSFDSNFMTYIFNEQIFLRDVDSSPIIISQADLLSR
jgi:carbamoyl-phosphate synthase large subunit